MVFHHDEARYVISLLFKTLKYSFRLFLTVFQPQSCKGSVCSDVGYHSGNMILSFGSFRSG